MEVQCRRCPHQACQGPREQARCRGPLIELLQEQRNGTTTKTYPQLTVRDVADKFLDWVELHREAATYENYPRWLKPDLLIVDDMGMKQLPKRSGEYLFEVIMRRYDPLAARRQATGGPDQP